MFSDSAEFKSFVADTNADGIQEIMEASLAFGLQVEGADHNSRPQIMLRAQNAFGESEVTREDALRAFGVLLRDAKIHRLRRGQFVLTANSRFFAEGETTAAASQG